MVLTMNKNFQLSWESVVSEELKHINGMSNLPYEAKVKHQLLTNLAFRDTNKNDIFLQHLGLQTKEEYLGYGYWKGITNPVQHSQIPLHTDEDIDNLKTYAAIKGLATKQDGVGMHAPYFEENETPTGRGLSFSTDRDLREEEFYKIAKSIESALPGTAIVSAIEGFRTIDFAENIEIEDYHKICRESVAQALSDDISISEIRPFLFEADLLENDWEKYPNGEQYMQKILEKDDPELAIKLISVLQEISELEQTLCEENGLYYSDVNESIVHMITERYPQLEDGYQMMQMSYLSNEMGKNEGFEEYRERQINIGSLQRKPAISIEEGRSNLQEFTI